MMFLSIYRTLMGWPWEVLLDFQSLQNFIDMLAEHGTMVAGVLVNLKNPDDPDLKFQLICPI